METHLRKKDAVREQVLQRLLTGVYRFGDTISVRALSEETGISRQPILTALSSLSAEGLVTVVAQVGCEVAAPSAEEISDFYLMFERLEGLMAELAAKRRTEDQLRRLNAINTMISMIKPTDKDATETYRLLNREFHGLIHDMARSPLLEERQANIFTMSDFFIVQTVGFLPHLMNSADEHQAIISAISDKNPKAARRAAERHILEVAKYVTSEEPV